MAGTLGKFPAKRNPSHWGEFFMDWDPMGFIANLSPHHHLGEYVWNLVNQAFQASKSKFF